MSIHNTSNSSFKPYKGSYMDSKESRGNSVADQVNRGVDISYSSGT